MRLDCCLNWPKFRSVTSESVIDIRQIEASIFGHFVITGRFLCCGILLQFMSVLRESSKLANRIMSLTELSSAKCFGGVVRKVGANKRHRLLLFSSNRNMITVSKVFFFDSMLMNRPQLKLK